MCNRKSKKLAQRLQLHLGREDDERRVTYQSSMLVYTRLEYIYRLFWRSRLRSYLPQLIWSKNLIHNTPTSLRSCFVATDLAIMPVILISGAGSGIGHTFLEHYAKDKANTIHAIDVSWSEVVKPKEAAAEINTHTVNSASKESVDELISRLNNTPIDLFIHSAAIRGLNPEIQEKESDPAKAEAMDVVDEDIFQQTLG